MKIDTDAAAAGAAAADPACILPSTYTQVSWFPTKRLKSKIQDPIFRGVRETGQPETGREKNSRSNF